MLARDTGIPASERLQIKDEVTALEFDLAVSLRLFQFDNKKDRDNRNFWIRMLGGTVDDDDDSILNAELVNNDAYADKNTVTW